MNKAATVCVSAMALGASAVCGAMVMKNAPEKFAPAFKMPAGMSPEELAADPAAADAMMAEWAQMNMPGEHHEMLGYFAGDWETEVKMWLDPAQPPMVTTGTSTSEMVMGGRFVHMTYETDMMGVTLAGAGYIGYDNVSGKYQSMWVDSSTTAMRFLEGHSDRTGDVVAMYGGMDEPQLGIRDRLIGYVFEIVDENTYRFDVKDFHIGAENNSVVVITFKRKV